MPNIGFKRDELWTILDDFGQGCENLTEIADIPEPLVIEALDHFKETCSDVINVDLNSLDETALKSVLQQLKPVCGEIIGIWDEFDEEDVKVDNIIYSYKHSVSFC